MRGVHVSVQIWLLKKDLEVVSVSLVKYILCFALVEFEPNLECLFDGGDDGT